MNAVTPAIEAAMLATGAAYPVIPGMPVQMSSNIARDLKSRASDFRSKAAAIFEYVVNAYEGYQLDQDPIVEITTVNGKIVIKDHGIGMSFVKLLSFWVMHGSTERRENGRNRRGYHGSGKSAFWAIAEKIEVRSVQDGVVNVMSLDAEEIEKAANDCTPPRIKQDKAQRPTDEPSGTTVTISRLRERFTAEDVRLLRDKISENLRLVMTGATVTVNGVPVEERPVRGTATEQTSECGNFTIRIVHNDAGHSHEDDRVFFMVGGVYIAAMQTGKEGHRFSHQVSALVDTTHEWAEANFEHRREQFMSEARDLTLKTSDPAARQLHDFAEQAVRAFMKHLEEEDTRRKKEQDSEQEKRLVAVMSRLFSSMALFGGASTREQGQREKRKETTTTRTRQESSGKRQQGERKPKITFGFKDFEMVDEPYQLQPDTLQVLFNRNSKVVKALSQNEGDMVRNAVLWDIAAQAVSQIVVAQSIKRKEETEGPVSINEAMELSYEVWGKVKNGMSDIYSGFLDRDPTA